MYEVNTYTLAGDNFLAGSMPVAKDALAVKEGETIKARSLVTLSSGKAAAYTATNAGNSVVPYGVAAADAENGSVVVYLSGEFFGSKLVLPEGVTAATVAPLLRQNGIFLKDLIPEESDATAEESSDEDSDEGSDEGSDEDSGT